MNLMRQFRNILVVDDDEMTRELICFKLREQGFSTIAVNDGLHAVLKINEEKPDLMILDVMLPDLSGIEVLNLVFNDFTEKIPVIMMSRLEYSKVKIAADKLGAIDYLVKPFEMEELLEKIYCVPGFEKESDIT